MPVRVGKTLARLRVAALLMIPVALPACVTGDGGVGSIGVILLICLLLVQTLFLGSMYARLKNHRKEIQDICDYLENIELHYKEFQLPVPTQGASTAVEPESENNCRKSLELLELVTNHEEAIRKWLELTELEMNHEEAIRKWLATVHDSTTLTPPVKPSVTNGQSAALRDALPTNPPFVMAATPGSERVEPRTDDPSQSSIAERRTPEQRASLPSKQKLIHDVKTAYKSILTNKIKEMESNGAEFNKLSLGDLHRTTLLSVQSEIKQKFNFDVGIQIIEDSNSRADITYEYTIIIYFYSFKTQTLDKEADVYKSSKFNDIDLPRIIQASSANRACLWLSPIIYHNESLVESGSYVLGSKT